MDFSDPYRLNGPCGISPDGELLALAAESALVIRDTGTMTVQQVFQCLDRINHVEWASNSVHILCTMSKRATVQIWSTAEPDWTARICQEAEGLVFARWAPDARHIITTSDFQLRLSVWSLVSHAGPLYIHYPKHASKGVSFTRNGQLMACALRKDCNDSIAIFSCATWAPVVSFPAATSDLSDLAWSLDGSHLVAWDSSLHHAVLVYHASGQLACKLQVPPGAGLGVKAVSWSPCGRFLGIGSFDQTLRVLTTRDWKPCLEEPHPAVLRPSSYPTVYKEVVGDDSPKQGGDQRGDDYRARKVPLATVGSSDLLPYKGTGVWLPAGAAKAPTSTVQVAALPFILPAQKLPPGSPAEKLGVSHLAWSADGEFVMTRTGSMPAVVWIWDIRRLKLAAVMVHRDPVKSAMWHPQERRIAYSTGTSTIYFWSPEGVSSALLPPTTSSVTINSVTWSPAGDGTVLLEGRDELFIGTRSTSC